MQTNEVLEQLRTNAEEMTTADVAKKVVAETKTTNSLLGAIRR